MFDQDSTGSLPNVEYGNAITLSKLRLSAKFIALPPVDAVTVDGIDSYCFIRQDDPLWGKLHDGVCTSSCIAAALGLLEPAAIKRQKLPKSRGGHHHILDAYRRLCKGQALIHNHVSGSPQLAIEDDTCDACAAMKRNLATIVAYNRSKSVLHLETDDKKETICCSAQHLRYVDPAAGSRQQIAKGSTNFVRRELCTDDTSTVLEEIVMHESNTLRGINKDVLLLKKAKSLSNEGLTAIRCAWGKSQEAASLEVISRLFPQSAVMEVGLCMLGALPETWGFQSGSLPPLGSSPDALLWHAGRQLSEGEDHRTLRSFCTDHQSFISGEFLQSILTREANFAEESMESIFLKKLQCGCMEASQFQDKCTEDVGHGGWWEVVEVKNVCPFGVPNQRKTRGSHKLVVHDRGPASVLNVSWIPQLQLHMLCTGTRSALLMSRSVLHGAKVFRVQRDDRYIHAMLCVLRKLWLQYILPRRPPSKNAFCDMKEQQEMIRLSKIIVEKSEIIAEATSFEMIDPALGCRFFLD